MSDAVDNNSSVRPPPPPPPPPPVESSGGVGGASGSAGSGSAGSGAAPPPMEPAKVEATASVQQNRGEAGQRLLNGGATPSGGTQGSGGDPALPASGKADPYGDAQTTAAADTSKAQAAEQKGKLTAEQQAQVDSINNRFTAADRKEATDFDKHGANNDRRAALRDANSAASKITDPAQRDAFVKGVADKAGDAAGKIAKQAGPSVISNELTKLGEQGSKETAKQLLDSAVKSGQFENVVPGAVQGNVGEAASALRQERLDKAKELGSKVAQAVIPGADAAKKASEGDTKGAAKSAAVDAALTLSGTKLAGAFLGVAAKGLGTALKGKKAAALANEAREAVSNAKAFTTANKVGDFATKGAHVGVDVGGKSLEVGIRAEKTEKGLEPSFRVLNAGDAKAASAKEGEKAISLVQERLRSDSKFREGLRTQTEQAIAAAKATGETRTGELEAAQRLVDWLKTF